MPRDKPAVFFDCGELEFGIEGSLRAPLQVLSKYKPAPMNLLEASMLVSTLNVNARLNLKPCSDSLHLLKIHI